MEIVTKTVTTLVLTKSPTAKNLERGTISVESDEALVAELVNEVVIKVVDTSGTLITYSEFDSREFLQGLKHYRKSDHEGFYRSFVK